LRGRWFAGSGLRGERKRREGGIGMCEVETSPGLTDKMERFELVLKLVDRYTQHRDGLNKLYSSILVAFMAAMGFLMGGKVKASPGGSLLFLSLLGVIVAWFWAEELHKAYWVLFGRIRFLLDGVQDETDRSILEMLEEEQLSGDMTQEGRVKRLLSKIILPGIMVIPFIMVFTWIIGGWIINILILLFQLISFLTTKVC
jgi:hypothetical protein